MIDSGGLAQLQAESLGRHPGGMAEAWPAETAMDAEHLARFLEISTYCVLATSGTNRRALARPVAFVVVGTSFWCASGDGIRLRHLRTSPWASLAITDGGRGSHRGVVVDGDVEISDQAPSDVLTSYTRKHGPAGAWTVVWCEVRPHALFSYWGVAEPT